MSQIKIILSIMGISLLFYVFRMHGSVTLEDSGEFLLVAKSFGVAHPPGYILYSWLAGMFNLLPFSNLATKVHFFSALLGAGCISLVYQIALNLTKNFELAIIGAVFALIAPTLTWIFTVADVYPLISFIVLLCIYLIVKNETIDQKTFYLLCLLIGLGFSAHWPLLVLCLPAFVFFIPRFKFEKYFIGFGCFAIGLIPILLVYFRSQNPSDYLVLGTISDWKEWLEFVLRAQYKNVDSGLSPAFTDNLLHTREFFIGLIKNFSLFGFILVGCGLYQLIKNKNWKLAFTLSWLLICHNLILRIFINTDFDILFYEITQAYQSVSLLTATLLIVLGFQYIIQRFHNHFKSNNKLIALYIAVVCLAFTLALHPANFAKGTKNTFASDIAKVYLSAVPSEQILLLHGDSDTGPILYVNSEEGFRKDVNIFSQVGFLVRPPGIEKFDDQWLQNISTYIIKQLQAGKSLYFIRIKPEIREFLQRLQINQVDHGLLKEFCVTGKCHGINNNMKLPVQKFVNQFLLRNYPNTYWSYYQESLLGPICKFMLKNQMESEIYERSIYCQYYQFSQFKKEGKKISESKLNNLIRKTRYFPKDERKTIEKLRN